VSDHLFSASRAAASGLAAQAARLRIVAENLANAHSTATVSGGEPYARKTVAFEAMLDDEAGAVGVRVGEIGRDRRPFPLERNPDHPAADEQGLVKLPNVNPLVELADMREAGRSYEANLQAIRQARELSSLTIELLRNGS
jgi:flagellar basal-body rod protein FlgC